MKANPPEHPTRIPHGLHAAGTGAAVAPPAPVAGARPGSVESRTLAETDCTVARLASQIPVNAIGEPVSAITLDAPQWHAEANGLPRTAASRAACAGGQQRDGEADSVRRGAAGVVGASRGAHGRRRQQRHDSAVERRHHARRRAAPPTGFATYGSDSGHQAGNSEWALNDEAVANLGYMQAEEDARRGHDPHRAGVWGEAAVQLLLRQLPGGREALTVAQRYSADYDGSPPTVPIVSYSSLMLGLS